MLGTLKLDGLNAWYGHSHVLQGVSLEVNAGEKFTTIHFDGHDCLLRVPNIVKRVMRCHDFGSEREAGHAA